MFQSQDHTRLTMTSPPPSWRPVTADIFSLFLLAQLWLLRKIESIWKITPKFSSRF